MVGAMTAPRLPADPMRTARLLEALHVLSVEAHKLTPEERLQVILASVRIRQQFGLL